MGEFKFEHKNNILSMIKDGYKDITSLKNRLLIASNTGRNTSNMRIHRYTKDIFGDSDEVILTHEKTTYTHKTRSNSHWTYSSEFIENIDIIVAKNIEYEIEDEKYDEQKGISGALYGYSEYTEVTYEKIKLKKKSDKYLFIFVREYYRRSSQSGRYEENPIIYVFGDMSLLDINVDNLLPVKLEWDDETYEYSHNIYLNNFLLINEFYHSFNSMQEEYSQYKGHKLVGIGKWMIRAAIELYAKDEISDYMLERIAVAIAKRWSGIYISLKYMDEYNKIKQLRSRYVKE